jgi:hypothetical protein
LALNGVLSAQNGVLVFTRDHLFSSPSMAAMAVMGRSANGWIEWKAANGKTEAARGGAGKLNLLCLLTTYSYIKRRLEPEIPYKRC